MPLTLNLMNFLKIISVLRQSAEVMLMMRDEGQMSSDFQEYTLIALFSLAAHLAGGIAAERATLPAMARYYNQDEDTLNQVLHAASALAGSLTGARPHMWTLICPQVGDDCQLCMGGRPAAEMILGSLERSSQRGRSGALKPM